MEKKEWKRKLIRNVWFSKSFLTSIKNKDVVWFAYVVTIHANRFERVISETRYHQSKRCTFTPRHYTVFSIPSSDNAFDTNSIASWTFHSRKIEFSENTCNWLWTTQFKYYWEKKRRIRERCEQSTTSSLDQTENAIRVPRNHWNCENWKKNRCFDGLKVSCIGTITSFK